MFFVHRVSFKRLLAVVLFGNVLLVLAILGGAAQYVIGSRNELLHRIEGVRAAKEARFHAIQVQQFITDASLTQDREVLKEAEENFNLAKADLEQIAKIFPAKKGEVDALLQQLQELNKTGVEMANAYWDKGKDAGNLIMKREKTGLDDLSSGVAQQLEALVQYFDKEVHDATAQSDRVLLIRSGLSLGALTVFLILMLGAVNRRVKPLQAVTHSVTVNSEQLHEVSDHVNVISKGLNDASTSQASAVQQTVASLTEIEAMIKSTQESSENLRAAAEVCGQAARSGQESMSSMVRAMESVERGNETLLEEIGEGNRRILEIVKLIGEIQDKTKIINDIVFQTKLLSFNASVEAARSGEHGKGFSVVAEEVGALAASSGNAAKEIAQLLVVSTDRVEGILQENKERTERLLTEARQQIGETKSIVGKCNSSLGDILTQVGTVQSRVGEIATAIGEQTRGIAQVAQAMQVIDSESQGAASNSRKAAEQARTLLEKAVALQQVTVDMQELVMGADRAS